MKAASAAQLAAIRVLHEVMHRRHSLNAVLESALATIGDRDRPLAAQLCYGTVRWYLRLYAVLGRLLNAPLRSRDGDVESLLLLGLYELESLATPEYAVVDRSVETVRALGKPWAARLVNAVLRRFSREREALLNEVDKIDSQRLATPSGRTVETGGPLARQDLGKTGRKSSLPAGRDGMPSISRAVISVSAGQS